jgi:hypothetical protein
MKRTIAGLILALGVWAVAGAQAASGQEGPDREAFGPAQSAADVVREAAGADIALLPAGIMVRDFSGDGTTSASWSSTRLRRSTSPS